MTRDGAPGLAPMAATPGDVVSVLLGCNIAMILRPTKTGYYEVIGEAYCDSFIDGEALLGPFHDSFTPVLRYLPGFGVVWAYLDQQKGIIQAEDP